MPNLNRVKSELLSVYLLETNNTIDRYNVLNELEIFIASLRKLQVTEEFSKSGDEIHLHKNFATGTITEVKTKNYPEYVFTESELDRLRSIVSEMQMISILEVQFINGSTILREVAYRTCMDSLDQIEMIMAIEEEFICFIDENIIEPEMTFAQLLGVATFE